MDVRIYLVAIADGRAATARQLHEAAVADRDARSERTQRLVSTALRLAAGRLVAE